MAISLIEGGCSIFVGGWVGFVSWSWVAFAYWSCFGLSGVSASFFCFFASLSLRGLLTFQAASLKVLGRAYCVLFLFWVCVLFGVAVFSLRWVLVLCIVYWLEVRFL